MNTIMNDTHIKTLDQVRQFLEGTEAVELAINCRDERYAWIEQTLIRLGYWRLSKADRVSMNAWRGSRWRICITCAAVRPTGPCAAISIRRARGRRRSANAATEGRPGFLRVDTVHQGDLDGAKGVYHINAVDEVTQFEIVGAVEAISERYLIPVLAAQLAQFPFRLVEFHTDNGSEYINRHVADLLNKLLIELTKSRARQSNDNALVESKNGAIVRKHLGYVHIPQHWAPAINAFYQEFLNPYINFHRPCFFPVVRTDAKGKQRKRYPYKAMTTPYERFKSLSKPADLLKLDVTLGQLDDNADAISDNEAARQLNEAKRKLFKTISEQESKAA
jgi:transposase InsO family protein